MPHTTQDSELQSRVRPDRFPILRQLVAPILIFAMGLAAYGLANELLNSPTGYRWATALAWHTGPWRNYPVPFSSHVFDRSNEPAAAESLVALYGSAACAIVIFAMILTALHAGLFAVVLMAYRRFGWPPYLNDIAERVSRMEIWRTSVRRSWWVLPFFACSQNLWYWFAMGQSYAQLSSVPLGEPFELALDGLAAAAYGLIAGRTIKSFVCSAIKPEEYRCTQCAYLRRGLASSVCPECGHELTGASPDFGLYRSATIRRLVESRVPWIVLTALTLTSPAWLVGLLASVPASMLSSKMSPWVRSLVVQQQSRPWGTPVKLGAFALIRTNDMTIAIYAPTDPPPGLRVRWWHWNSSSAWTSRRPDETGVKLIPPNMQSQEIIARLPFYFYIQQWGSDRWLHFGWAAMNVECEVLEPDQAPEILRKLAGAATTRPS